MRELHRIRGAALGHRTKVRGIAEHLRQRYPGVDRLRRHHVLYDRSVEGGELFHVYTRSFEDRFFFEVLERRGGYDQYGAANAPVRMSAQAQLHAAAAERVRG